MSAPLPLAEAQARLLSKISPLPIERVPVEAATGRCLAEPLLARRTQPAADLSAMDGYAMRLGTETAWTVVGESAAGHPFMGSLKAGEAIRISTGALMPEGADAVLLQENATRSADALALNGEDRPTSRHIRRKGFDFHEGDVLLDAGTRIGPGQLGLAISAGASTLPVHMQPRICIIDSGDELAADGAPCAPHQIPASNGAMLAAMTAPFASAVSRIGPVPDNLASLAAALQQADGSDVIVTSGGASVGEHDLIRPALEAWGAQISFWRVAMKPGKPLLVAHKGACIVLGLPGNPVSSYVTAQFFLLPLLRALGGDSNPLPRPIPFMLGADLPAGGPRLEFLRGRISEGMAVPVNEQDSSAQRALASAEMLIERPANAPPAPRGSVVGGYLLQNGGVA